LNYYLYGLKEKMEPFKYAQNSKIENVAGLVLFSLFWAALERASYQPLPLAPA
jgi:hypothetical protein